VVNAGTIDVGVVAGKLVSGTGGNGIQTNSGLSSGATNIQVAGQVKSTGAGNAATRAQSSNGAITFAAASTGTLAGDTGLDLITVSGPIQVSNAGSIIGDAAGIKMVATGAGNGTISNSGTLSGTAAALNATLNGGNFTLNNAGLITGLINVTGSAVATSNFANSGIWNTGSSLSTFSGNLNNTGLINAQNGLTGNQIIVGGAYTGSGTIAFDYNTKTATADILRIGGTASGNTIVALNRLERGMLTSGFLPLVTAAGGGLETTFTSANIFPTAGFMIERFGQNPLVNTQWGIIQEVNQSAIDLTSVEALSMTVSNLLDEPTSAFTASGFGEADGKKFSVWVRGDSGKSTQDIASTFQTGSINTTRSARLGIEQSLLQVGADYTLRNLAGRGLGLTFGLTAGSLEALVEPRGSTSRIKVKSNFTGGYAVLATKRLTVDVAIREEERDFSIESAALFGGAIPVSFDGEATTTSFFASYRFGQDMGFQITPQIGYINVDAKADSFAVDEFTTFSPGSDTRQIGRLGVTLSYRGITPNGSIRYEPFFNLVSSSDSASNAKAQAVYLMSSREVFDIDTNTFSSSVKVALGFKALDRSGRLATYFAASVANGRGYYAPSVSARVRFAF
jgi:hypothetical protein